MNVKPDQDEAERLRQALGASRVVQLSEGAVHGPLDWLRLRAEVLDARSQSADRTQEVERTTTGFSESVSEWLAKRYATALAAADLAGQTVRVLAWPGPMDRLQADVRRGKEPPGSKLLHAVVRVPPQEQRENPSRCMAQWDLTPARQGIRGGLSFFVLDVKRNRISGAGLLDESGTQAVLNSGNSSDIVDLKPQDTFLLIPEFS